MANATHPRHPAMNEIAGIGVRVVLTAVGCGLLAAAIALLAGCATVAPESIVEPVRQAAPSAAAAEARSGTIFVADSYRPMFEDRRARLVGDTLIIAISEKTSAGKNVASSQSKDGSVGVTVPGPYVGMNLEAAQSMTNADKSAANAANNFTGTVTATVTEVLPNGNLRVRGEKQVAFDKGTEFIRFSGVVNPATISAANSVPSTSVADMRVEYRTNANFDKASLQSALARFFFSVLPL